MRKLALGAACGPVFVADYRSATIGDADLHYVGWCEEHGVTLSPPGSRSEIVWNGWDDYLRRIDQVCVCARARALVCACV
jgi:hypothetical protein